MSAPTTQRIEKVYQMAVNKFGEVATEQSRIRRHQYAVGYTVCYFGSNSDWSSDYRHNLQAQARYIEAIIEESNEEV